MLIMQTRISFSQPSPDSLLGTSQSSGAAPLSPGQTLPPLGATPPASLSAVTPRPIDRGGTPAHHRYLRHSPLRDNGAMTPVTASPGGSTPSSAVEAAKSISGAHERSDNALIRKYLATGGHGMNPADTAWCASFVGASLRKAGVKDVPASRGGNVATSYERWGVPVDPAKGVSAGDVLVETRGLGPGRTGGHVGLLTGRVKDGRVEMISGNYGNRVKTSWEKPGGRNMIRRAGDAELPRASEMAKARESLKKPE
ncbi:hypothetical protein [Methylocella tundrae]|uniref:Peptidase C51 domain-containing protein n=1 Tax=Methylocella tundrae TaxID=227605 RepID=A0A4U8Z0H8_METTU|nr:hypothetical protein [Methylocella tundrae]WPP05512.1 hypothetical protein SIN04_06720 [Methylocella tundrae]VFU07938.1 protein of unknown function [Methylocella tundrae]